MSVAWMVAMAPGMETRLLVEKAASHQQAFVMAEELVVDPVYSPWWIRYFVG